MFIWHYFRSVLHLFHHLPLHPLLPSISPHKSQSVYNPSGTLYNSSGSNCGSIYTRQCRGLASLIWDSLHWVYIPQSDCLSSSLVRPNRYHTELRWAEPFRAVLVKYILLKLCRKKGEGTFTVNLAAGWAERQQVAQEVSLLIGSEAWVNITALKHRFFTSMQARNLREDDSHVWL